MDEKLGQLICMEENKLNSLYMIDETQIHLVLDTLEKSSATLIFNAEYKRFHGLFVCSLVCLALSFFWLVLICILGHHFFSQAISGLLFLLLAMSALLIKVRLQALIITRQNQRQETYQNILDNFNSNHTFKYSGIHFSCSNGGAQVTLRLADTSQPVPKSAVSLRELDSGR